MRHILRAFFWSFFGIIGLLHSVHAMTPLDERAMGDVAGQAAFYTNNTQSVSGDPSGSSFYTLGIQGKVDLNLNINRLQLGCGGVNGAGGCDLDIDKLGLSGNPGTGSCPAGAARASCDATLTNPFLRLAIKNPGTLATRQVIGLQLGAALATGLLTAGTDNSDTSGPNGINSFSGFMNIGPANGVATTQTRNMTYGDTGMTINGKVKGCPLLCPFGIGVITVPFSSNDYNLALSSATAPFVTNAKDVTGKRQVNTILSGIANIGQINFSGQLKATVIGVLDLNKTVNGNITGLKANLTVDESLGYIHKIPINNPFSLSMQNQNVLWPNSPTSLAGNPVVAETGWWMAFKDQINLGSVTPSNQVQITNAVLQQVVTPISNNLTSNPRDCGNLLTGCLLGSSLEVGNVPLNNTSVAFPLTNLVLAAQTPASNCYGNLKFC